MSQYEVKSYFVPGFGISRHIIFSHIQIYLGPDASVRPYSYRGREGYLVTAPGQPLTRVSYNFEDSFRSYQFSQSLSVFLDYIEHKNYAASILRLASQVTLFDHIRENNSFYVFSTFTTYLRIIKKPLLRFLPLYIPNIVVVSN